jgi:hypothetical protein
MSRSRTARTRAPLNQARRAISSVASMSTNSVSTAPKVAAWATSAKSESARPSADRRS